MKQFTIFILMLSLMISCGSKKSSIKASIQPPQVNVDPDPDLTTRGRLGRGAVITLTNTPASEPDLYSLSSQGVQSDNIQVEIDLELMSISEEIYKGKIIVTHTNRLGIEVKRTFYSGDSSADNKYNKLIKDGDAFHAIFDDARDGAIVLVINQFIENGDGVDQKLLANGSVWFYNYPYLNQGQAPHPIQDGDDGEYCWEIRSEIGPYRCMPWNSDVEADNTDVPLEYFKLLGKILKLNVEYALNGDI